MNFFKASEVRFFNVVSNFIFFILLTYSTEIMAQIKQPNLNTKPSSIHPIPSKLPETFPKIQRTLKIGVIENPPYVIKKVGKYTGLAVDIWEATAKSLNWQFQYVPLPNNLKAAFRDLQDKKIDVLIGAIPVDDIGLDIVDFSRPIFINRIGIIYKETSQSFWTVFKSILSYFVNYKLLIILVIFILFCHFVWLVERRASKGVVHKKKYMHGIGNIIWFAFLSFIAQQTNEPFAVTHFLSRILFAIWLTFSVIVVSLFIASVTSALTISLSQPSQISTPHDIENKHVAYIKGSIDEGNVTKLGVIPIATNSISDAFKMLKNGKVVAIIAPISMAKYYIRERTHGEFQISRFIVAYDEYAFAFQSGEVLKKEFDIVFDRLKETEHFSPLCAKYIGVEDAKLCSL